jgi:hypothetical protein
MIDGPDVMSDPNTPGPPAARERRPALRASDADREQVAEILRQAAADGRIDVEELDERLHLAYSTRTRAELEPLTADLVPAAPPQPAPGAPRTVTVQPGDGGTSSVISIMGGNDRKGRWRIAPRCFVLNVMGGTDLDLNEVELSDQVTTITVVSIMGGGDIRVPHGVEVNVSKMAIMGGNDVKLTGSPAPAGAPVIHLRLFSLMGGTDVRQGPKRSRAEKRQRKLEARQRRQELDP